jgi:protein-tyrosine phosphatase
VTGGRAEAAPAAVLFVCTGNLCRSPAAELLFRRRVPAGLEVASAGLRAAAGRPVAAPTAALLRARGVDPRGVAARQLVPALVRDATLVLTMTAEQRAAVVSGTPAAVRRTFTLREFVALARLAEPPAEREPAGRLAALVTGAGRARAVRGPAGDDDIADPYGRSDADHARALALVEAAVDELATLLAGSAADAA